jgi:hypothetical protein
VTPEEFQRQWERLPTPTSTTELEAGEALDGSGVWIARDHTDRQHLLVRVPDGVVAEVTGTQGLSVAVGRHRIASHSDASYIDLVCLEPAVAPTFAAVAADIVNETTTADPDDRRGRVLSVLSEWRWFWSVDPAQLSSSDAVGLFGELWFLLRWAGVSAESVNAWDASNRARHDFQWPERSVEVKVTSRAGAPVHTVQDLEQLADAESGDLYLYSLRIRRDALATNSLTTLVDAAMSALTTDSVARAELRTKLIRRGYTPAGREQSAVPYRVIDESLYHVTGSFPRLTNDSFPDSLPTGIAKVSYQLDMNACIDWRLGTTSDVWPPGHLSPGT